MIVGLESLANRQALVELLMLVGRERLVFSLDLKDGRPITRVPEWRSSEPIEIARSVFELGVRSMIVLDLARVGVGGGWRGNRSVSEDVARHATGNGTDRRRRSARC